MKTNLEEAVLAMQNNKKRCDMLVEEYVNTSIGNPFGKEGLRMKDLSPEKQRLIANAVKMEENHLKSRLLNETLVSSAFGTTPENVLKIITLGIANSIRGMAFYEYPLSTMNDAFYWIHKEREKTLRDGVKDENIFLNPRRRYAGESDEIVTSTTGGAQYTVDVSSTYSSTTGKVLIKGKIMILLDDKLIGVDDGNGLIVPMTADLEANPTATWNEVDYDAGIVKLEFAAGVNGKDIRTILHFDSEQKDLFDNHLGTMSMSVEKKTFAPRQMPLGYSFTDLTALQIGSTGLGDVHDILVRAAGEEHALARDYRAIQLANNISEYNKKYTWNADFGAEGEVSAKSHAQNILSRIDDIGGDIQDEIKRGEPNVILAGSRAITYFKKHDLWVSDNSMVHQGIYKAGTLDGKAVFFVPKMDYVIQPNEAIISYKSNTEETDCPLIFGTFTELQAELRDPSLRTNGTIATVEDQMVLEKKFIRKLTIENL